MAQDIPDFINNLDINNLDLSSLPWYRAENSVKTLWDFIAAVDWPNEKTLQAVVGFHFLMALLIIYSWHNSNLRVPLWLFLITLAFASEKLNEYLSHHYKSFGIGEQYFDSSGKFILLIWAGPILILICVLTFKMLKDLWETLIDYKVKQIKLQRRKQAKEQKGEKGSTKDEAPTQAEEKKK